MKAHWDRDGKAKGTCGRTGLMASEGSRITCGHCATAYAKHVEATIRVEEVQKASNAANGFTYTAPAVGSMWIARDGRIITVTEVTDTAIRTTSVMGEGFWTVARWTAATGSGDVSDAMVELCIRADEHKAVAFHADPAISNADSPEYRATLGAFKFLLGLMFTDIPAEDMYEYWALDLCNNDFARFAADLRTRRDYFARQGAANKVTQKIIADLSDAGYPSFVVMDWEALADVAAFRAAPQETEAFGPEWLAAFGESIRASREAYDAKIPERQARTESTVNAMWDAMERAGMHTDAMVPTALRAADAADSRGVGTPDWAATYIRVVLETVKAVEAAARQLTRDGNRERSRQLNSGLTRRKIKNSRKARARNRG